MSKLSCCVLSALLLISSNVFAGPIRTYVGASAGVALPDNSLTTDASGIGADVSYDPGLSLSGLIGQEFGRGVRLEGEVNYKKVNTDKFKLAGTTNNLNSDFRSIGMMANVYYDFYVNRAVTPYIGGGLGFANVNISSADVKGVRVWNSDSATAFAYQAGLGCNVMMNRWMAFDLGYRYYGTSEYKIDQVTSSFNSHNILFGLKYYIN